MSDDNPAKEGDTMKCLKCGSELVGEHCPGCLADDIMRVCGPKAVAATRGFCEKVATGIPGARTQARARVRGKVK